MSFFCHSTSKCALLLSILKHSKPETFVVPAGHEPTYALSTDLLCTHLKLRILCPMLSLMMPQTLEVLQRPWRRVANMHTTVHSEQPVESNFWFPFEFLSTHTVTLSVILIFHMKYQQLQDSSSLPHAPITVWTKCEEMQLQSWLGCFVVASHLVKVSGEKKKCAAQQTGVMKRSQRLSSDIDWTLLIVWNMSSTWAIS